MILILVNSSIPLVNGEEDAVTFEQSAYQSLFKDTDTGTRSRAHAHANSVHHDDDDGYHCQPRQIHLSLGDRNKNQNENDVTKTSMRVSFSIPYRANLSCHPERTSIVIQYGINKNNPSVSDTDTDTDTVHETENSKDADVVIRQYNTVSPTTGELYESDFIYHVALNDLEGSTDYWYRILVNVNVNVNVEQYHDSESSRTSESESEKKGEMASTRSGAMANLEFEMEAEEKRSLRSHVNNNRNAQANKKHVYQTNKMTFKTAPTRSRPSATASARSSETHTSKGNKSMHAKSHSRPPVKFAIVGDLGQTYNSTSTMINILASTYTDSEKIKHKHKHNNEIKTPVTALLIAGDMSYANSIQPQWDNWGELIQPIASRIPMMVAAGNHEIECDAISHIPFLAYENRFYMPNRIQDAILGPVDDKYFNDHSKYGGCACPSDFIGDYDYGNAFYSFDYGIVKTIVLSSYSDTTKGSNQYKWLKEELKAVDRKETPWLVIMMHTQFYTTFKAHNNESETTVMCEAMEKLFKTYQVNFVFSGHDHAYMRSKPLYRGKVDKSGLSPIYMIVGEGGNREKHVRSYLHNDPEEWVEVRDKSVYGFGSMEFVNETTAFWEWTMDGTPNERFEDDVWLRNQYL